MQWCETDLHDCKRVLRWCEAKLHGRNNKSKLNNKHIETMKRILMLCAAMFALVANAQSEQWKAYLDICGQFRADMTPCEKMSDCFSRRTVWGLPKAVVNVNR